MNRSHCARTLPTAVIDVNFVELVLTANAV